MASDKQPYTREQYATRARLASHTSWAQTADREQRTAAARKNSPQSLAYWLDRVPAEVTDADARLAAAKSAHKARMTALALASSRSRAAKRQQSA